jgi:hypothetical protein
MAFVGEADVTFLPPEMRQKVFPRPIVSNRLRPPVVIFAASAHISHHVHGTAAADDIALRHAYFAPEKLILWGGDMVLDVGASAQHHLEGASGHLDQLIIIVGAGF